MERQLEAIVMSEADVMNRLDLTKKQLDHLRWNKSFPCVQLSRTTRVYLIEDVLDFIERLSRDQSYHRSLLDTLAARAVRKEERIGNHSR